MLRSIIRGLEEWPKVPMVLLASALFLLVAILNTQFVADEISWILLFLLPIAVASRFLGRTAGISFSVLSVGAWLAAEVAAGAELPRPLPGYWNTAGSFGVFLVVSLGLAANRVNQVAVARARQRERQIAGRDPLTGLLNSSGFFRLAEARLRSARSSGESVGVAFIDVNNLSAYNERYGRIIGDVLLAEIGLGIRQNLWLGDLAARLGGDEFAILLTGLDPEGARRFTTALDRMFQHLQAKKGRPIQASIGMVLSMSAQEELPLLLERAEQLMRSVQVAGRNGVRLEIYGAQASRPAQPVAPWTIPGELPRAAAGTTDIPGYAAA